MPSLLTAAALLAALLVPVTALAHKDTDPPHQRYDMGDLKLDLFPNLRRHVLMRVASTPEAIIQVLRCPVEEIKRGKRSSA